MTIRSLPGANVRQDPTLHGLLTGMANFLINHTLEKADKGTSRIEEVQKNRNHDVNFRGWTRFTYRHGEYHLKTRQSPTE